MLLRLRLGPATFELRLRPTWAFVADLPPAKRRIRAGIFVTSGGGECRHSVFLQVA